jgi:hypothetical protein
MKVIIRVLVIISILGLLAAGFGCGPKKDIQTEPQVEVPKEPSIEELRKPVAKDPGIYKAIHVIKEVGEFQKQYISYEKYLELTSGKSGVILDPDWFYDSYILNFNEKGYWATVTFGTAKRAIERDPRIEKLMTDLPENSITVKLKTPSGRTYLFTDAEADGIVDFAKDASQKNVTKIDIQLLDQMQEKYTWLMNIVKKHYKK